MLSLKDTHSSRCVVLWIPVVLFCSQIDLEVCRSILLDLHYTRRIPTSIAVIWRRPDRYQGIVEHVFVTFLYQLMSSRYQVDSIDMIELRRKLVT